MYFLNGQKMIYSKLVNWEEFFNKISKKGDWLKVM